MKTIVNDDVDATLVQFGGLVFVFVGDEYAGSAEKGDFDVWVSNPIMNVPGIADEFHDNMFAAVGAVITTHAVASLALALAV